MTTIPFHPLANLFPMIEGRARAELKEDIRRHGVQKAIVLYEEMILDGRNRYELAEETGVPFETVLYADLVAAGKAPADPLAFVLSHNLHRRHLSDSQRAMVAARVANMRQGARTDREPRAELHEVSAAEAGEMLSVSERSVKSARQVAQNGAPELVAAVDRGSVAVSAAAQIARLPLAEQTKIFAEVARAPDGKKALARVAKDLRAERQAEKKARRTVREAELGARQEALPERRYGVIYADPEWEQKAWSDLGLEKAACNHYPVSPTEEIAARPVGDIAAADAILFLWATVPHLADALGVMAAWGFAYKSSAVWVKESGLGMGYWFRVDHEILLVGTRGSPPAPAQGTQERSVFRSRKGEHSEKPEAVAEMIERLWPSLAKIELNRRGPAREGWDAWGNEAEEGVGNRASTQPAEASPSSASLCSAPSPSGGEGGEAAAPPPDASRNDPLGRLVALLSARAGETVPREELAAALFGAGDRAARERLGSLVYRARGRGELAGLVTVKGPGGGYRLEVAK
ncbi:MT-A70 family methyltransferase [Afifella sp. IM 167]|uniref:MT-A70 family methyltransferase n=1 Tax=Afifella sp. IM 167 TaxID=2033586 RepID=UPI001CCA4A01|nr:MT-A70 family methyltransferase [Afifella sp. IM 167]